MDGIVNQLETVLRDKYGYTGTLENIKFSSHTQEALQQLIDVLQESNAETVGNCEESPSVTTNIDNTPKIGDIAFVYWCGYGWFTATIERWLPEELSYMICWTDGNWAPEKAKYTNLCVDKVPDAATIGVGTKVLFKQGLYYCGYDDDGSICDSTGRTLSEEKKQEIGAKGQISDRWHMGRITEVAKDDNGEAVYNGEHARIDDPQVSSGGYVDYSRTFEGLRIAQLRTLPNIFNCFHSSADAKGESHTCDIFVSKVAQDDTSVQRIHQQIKNKFSVSETKGQASAASLQRTVGEIKNCKVYLVCLSDNFIADQQAMSELLYAKKTLGKTVIPLVIGRSGKWSQTTAGMLLAGQLYIQFGSDDDYNEKIGELQSNLEKLVVADSSGPKCQLERAGSTQPPRVFLSYCWSNSKASFDAGQVRSFTGHAFSDPRKIKSDIEDIIGEKVWLDIEQLNSVDDSGMFGQIAQGLSTSQVVVMCVSKEYSNSLNCQMEANFALRSLHKKAIVLEVGSGEASDVEAWTRSSVGMVLPTDEKPYNMTGAGIDNSDTYRAIIEQICLKLKDAAPADGKTGEDESSLRATDGKTSEDESSLRATVPMFGDAVIAHYAAWQFFPAKVASFDKATMQYTVDWDDPDPSCRVQRYQLVAVNRTPNENEIGIGTSILFKQGIYQYGSSSGDVWNLGEITKIEEVAGEKLYSGKHSKTAEEGLAVAGWPSYRPTFEHTRYHDLRLFPNAIEMLQAYRNL